MLQSRREKVEIIFFLAADGAKIRGRPNTIPNFRLLASTVRGREASFDAAAPSRRPRHARRGHRRVARGLAGRSGLGWPSKAPRTPTAMTHPAIL